MTLNVKDATAVTRALRTTTVGGELVPNSIIYGSDTAHDAVDAGNPVKVGGRARTSDVAAVANDDRVDAIYDKIGRVVTDPYAIPENFENGTTGSMTGTADTDILAATVGVRHNITQLVVTNAHATVGTIVHIKDNTTIKESVYVGPGQTVPLTFPVPLSNAATNTAWKAANVTTGSNVYVSASGYKSA